MNAEINKKVLIVEDEAPLREALLDGFQAESNITVLSATNGQEGIAAAQAEHPDLILLDIVMPVMDGMEMLKALRAGEWGKEAAVVLLTNVNDTVKVAEALEQNTHDYLIKSDHTVAEIVKITKQKLGLVAE